MNRLIAFLFLCITVSCAQNTNQVSDEKNAVQETRHLTTESYQLFLPKKQHSLLILFPCFPCDAANTETEFDIVEAAMENHVAVLMMNFNQRLWLSTHEKIQLESTLRDVIDKNGINIDNTFIGGFSSGGNVSLLLTNYLKSTGSSIQPKGLFIVDSPIDLMGLYENAQENIEKNFSEPAVQESKWIVETFDAEFGSGDTSFTHYENKSPYLSKTHSLKNLSHLAGLTIRLYSEPDTAWWKENRRTEYEGMNAYYIEQLTKDLNTRNGKNSAAYIQTKNRGYRSNGDRHPHSWAIVDSKDLVDWIVNK